MGHTVNIETCIAFCCSHLCNTNCSNVCPLVSAVNLASGVPITSVAARSKALENSVNLQIKKN